MLRVAFLCRVWALCLAAVFAGAAPARAAVTITFYSHDFRMFGAGLLANFPHGFIILSGTPDDGSPALSGNFGFSATDFFINALWEPVEGSLDKNPLPASYVEGADRHFSFPLADAQYHAVVAVVDRWRTYPQPSYDIDKHNCVTFVKELAVAAGLSVSDSPRFIRKPKEFLADIAARNAEFLAPYGNVIQASAPGAGIEALRDRTRQLESQVKAVKEKN
jgi:hypothetical protein